MAKNRDDKGAKANAEQNKDVHARLADIRATLQLAHEALSQRTGYTAPAGDREEATDKEPPAKRNTVKLHVLKPFRFISSPIKHGEKLMQGGERIIPKGDNEFDLDDPMDRQFLNHSWIKDHLADGAIEHPDVTTQRLNAAAAEAEAKARNHRQIAEDAKAAFDRATLRQQNQEVSAAQLQDELNTPINQLRKGA